MHQRMNEYVHSSFEDADIIMVLVDPGMERKFSPELIENIIKAKVPKFLLINKADQYSEEELENSKNEWQKMMTFDENLIISALDEGVSAAEIGRSTCRIRL